MAEVTGKGPCDSCSSSDAMATYDDGGTYCFSCQKATRGSEAVTTTEGKSKKISPLIEVGRYQDLSARRISKATCEFFSYQIGNFSGVFNGEHLRDEQVHVANYCDEYGDVVAQKVRASDKRITCRGDGAKMSLYGQWKYQPNEKLFITVVEGEIDCLSVAEAQGTRFPVVSIPKGAAAAKKELAKHLEYLNGFKYVILGFDNDKAGKDAARECVPLFDPGKVRVINWGMKDANELLVAGKREEIKNAIWQAKEIREENIITFDEISLGDIQELSISGASLPFPKLDHMLGGLKSKHLYTLAAREKSGKTSITKEIALHLVDVEKKKVGLVYLEGDAVLEAVSFVAMRRNEPMWKLHEKLADAEVSQKVHDELQSFKESGLYLYNHKGAIDLQSVYNKVSYMAKGLKCDYIILDNLSIAMAGNETGSNERREIDNMVFKLVSLINNTGVTVLNVVHLVKNRKDGNGDDIETVSRSDVHGSGAFAKFSHGLLGLERDSANNRVKIKVLANRDKGTEGYADTLKYNEDTGRLEISADDEVPADTDPLAVAKEVFG